MRRPAGPILNRQTFKALPAYNLPKKEVKLVSSQAGSALNVCRFNIFVRHASVVGIVAVRDNGNESSVKIMVISSAIALLAWLYFDWKQ